MKKLLAVLFTLTLTLSMVTPHQASATQKDKVEKEKVIEEIKEVTSGTGMDIIDPSELPEGTPVINFDSIEEFKKAMKKYENNRKKDLEEEKKFNDAKEDLALTPEDEMSILATGIGSIKWYDYNWWEATIMNIHFNYSYINRTSGKLFTGASNISSFNSGINISNWHQTNKSYKIIDRSRTLQFSIQGYFLFGVNVKGVPVGAKATDSYVKYYYR